MGAQDLSIISLATLLLFFVPILYISLYLKLNINQAIISGVLRMCLQLSFVGLYLEFLFRLDSPWLNTAYLLVMISIACHSIIKSCNLRLRFFFKPVFLSLVIPFSVILLFFNAVVIRLDALLEAKYLIPIGGMLLGNCLRSNIIGLTHFYSGIRKNEREYLYSLTLFNSRIHALKPWFKQSLVAAVNPTLASMATIGLVSLPGMMTGQILGGSIPLVAIKYQIAIMVSIFYTEYFSVILSILFSLKHTFNAFDVLNPRIFNKS